MKDAEHPIEVDDYDIVEFNVAAKAEEVGLKIIAVKMIITPLSLQTSVKIEDMDVRVCYYQTEITTTTIGTTTTGKINLLAFAQMHDKFIMCRLQKVIDQLVKFHSTNIHNIHAHTLSFTLL